MKYKKKYVLAAVIILAMGMTACSLEMGDGAPDSGVVAEPEASVAENAETGTTKAETETEAKTETGAETEIGTEVKAEDIKSEVHETNAAGSDGEADSDEAEEIPQGDPIVVIVEKYEDDIIYVRDPDVGAIICFSTKNAEVIEGDSPIAPGDIVEITYRGVQGDEEHPGTAVKVVAESMMYR